MPCFIGFKLIDLNQEIQRIFNFPKYLPIKYHPPDILHLTLLYLGNVRISNDVLTIISNIIQQFKPFKIKIGPEIAIFPDITKPKKLVFLITKGVEILNKIRNRLIAVLKDRVKIEDKYLHNFQPHITVGDLIKKLSIEEIELVIDEFKRLNFEFEIVVNRLQLIDSTRALYKVLQEFYLKVD